MEHPEKIKLLYIITKSNFGGAQRYVYDLATAMPKKTYDVSVVLGGAGILKQKLDTAGVKTVSIGTMERDMNIVRDVQSFFALFKIFRDERPDIIHVNSSKAAGLGAVAGRLLFRARPQIIFTAHGVAFEEKRNIFQKCAIKTIYWIICALSDQTIAVSMATRSELAKLPLIKNKITLIYNGVRSAPFKEAKEARKLLLPALSQNILHPKTIWLGTISELHKNKGLPFLIEAAREIIYDKKYLNVILVIIGEGEERARLEKLIAEKGLAENVFLVGHKENPEELLSAFNIFTFPSVKEGLPYAILEAGRAGLPVVASAVGGIPEIIDDMRSGILVRPENAKEIARALEYIMLDASISEKFGEELKKRIKRRFSLERMARETLELYENIKVKP